MFLNLFLNARDAMPKGGWLSIATRTEGGRIIAEVSDTGREFRASTWRESTIRSSRPRRSARALDSVCRSPTALSASTKAASTATARLARARGSFFRFRRGGRAVALAGQHGRRARQVYHVIRNGSILVVDDEEIMREILDALLAREGYHVRLAPRAARRDSISRGRSPLMPPSST